jgi:hypothetical protein
MASSKPAKSKKVKSAVDDTPAEVVASTKPAKAKKVK